MPSFMNSSAVARVIPAAGKKMATLYVIPNWERDFENNKSRTVETLTWFPVQNHFDGKRINRIKILARPLEKYGAFHVIAAIASRCEYRGVLLDHDGPVGPREIADKTGFPLKELAAAYEQLSDPVIGLLEKHEIVQADDGSWPLPDTVRRWAIHKSTRRHRKDNGGTESPPSAASRPEVPQEAKPPKPPESAARGTEKHTGAPRGTESPPSAASRLEVPRREGKGIEGPPAVPQGGLSQHTSPRVNRIIKDSAEAKSLICEMILNGKNPSRLWSPDAENQLAMKCEEGLPLQEVLDIAWFRGLPKSDDYPELKKRIDPITETALMQYWGDEAQRAAAFRKKNNLARNGAEKQEPPKWREFFNWKYGDEITLPKTWAELGRDQQTEYKRDFQTSGVADLAEAEP